MAGPTFTIIIPTCGRPTLADTVASVTPQLGDGDELHLIRRDNAPWGHATRNHAMPHAAGSHLLFIDDDDRYLPDALTLIRIKLTPTTRHRVHLFSMRYDNGHLVQPRWPLEVGYVSTQMMCVPNSPDLLGVWGDRYEGDYDFIATTMLLRGDEPVLHADVIAQIGRPSHARAAA